MNQKSDRALLKFMVIGKYTIQNKMRQRLHFSKTDWRNLLRKTLKIWSRPKKHSDSILKTMFISLFVVLVLETPTASAQDNTIPIFSKVAGIQIANTNGQWVTVNPASPAYLDLVESRLLTMPPKGSGIARVEFKLYGGDGGTGRYLWGANNRFAKAGGGGIVSFSVDLSKKQNGEYIFAGQHFAVIFGKRGESKQISNGYFASGGGGGSTAMVRLVPGADKLTMNRLFENAYYDWNSRLLLASAGGGSGGFGFKDGVLDGNSATGNAVTTPSNYIEDNWNTRDAFASGEYQFSIITGGSNLWNYHEILPSCCTNDLKPRLTSGMVYNLYDAYVTYSLGGTGRSTLQSFIFGQKGGKPVTLFSETDGTPNSTGVGVWSLTAHYSVRQLGGQGGAGFAGGGAGSSTTDYYDLNNNANNIPTGGAGGTGSMHHTTFGKRYPNAGDAGLNNYSPSLDNVSISSRAKTENPESGMFMYRTIADTESPQINLSHMTVYLKNGTTPLGYNPEVTFQEAVQPYIMQENGFYDNDGIASVTGTVTGTPITKFECYMGRSDASEVPVEITVTDVAGNSTTKLVMIRVIDPFKPFVVSPDANNNPINVNDGPVTLTASHFPKGYDGCNGNNVTTVFSPTTFYCNDAGQKTISYHFLDRDGNTSPTYNRTFTIVCTNPSNDTGGDNGGDTGGNEDTGNNNNQNTNQRYLYVDKTAQGNNDGSSWANAFTDLQDAVNYNESATAIYVAQGTYYPTSTTDRAVSFILRDNAKVYGGFPTGGSSFTARNPEANPTILSGKISETQNSYHVVKMTGSNTHLEGFTIQDGKADETIPDGGGGVWVSGTNTTVRNCKFFNHYSSYFGGAFLGNGYGTLNIINCEFKDNLTELYGGAVFLYDNGMNVKIVNSIFHHNMSYNFGGAIASQNSMEITNCTFSYNNAGQGAGAIQSSRNTKLHNSILYFNTVTDPNPDFQITSQIHCSNAQADYCNIEGSGGSTAWTLETFNGVQDLGHNIDVNPVYNVSPALSINPASPCKDAGKNEYNTERYDIYGNSFRISGDAIDMGAFETGSVNIFVDKDAPNGGDGGSWATAFNNLHDAIDNAKATHRDIWIKEGTYRPDRRPGNSNSTPANRDNSYYIDADMKIYGGFAGTENSLSQRKNIGLHPVIISGDIGIVNLSADNTYHVVVIDTDNVVLDGLIIQDGNSDESPPVGDVNKMRGAGVFQFSGKAVVQNCVFRNNYATDKGSAWYSKADQPGTGTDFVQTLFYNNSGGRATAFFVSMGGATEPYTANFYNVTAFGNTSSNSGGGAFEAEEFTTNYPANLNFYNSLLAGNTPQNYNDATNPGNIILTNTVTATSGAEVFTNVSNIAGADGKIMTSDDGLMPKLGSAVSAGNAGLLYDYYGKDWDITGNPRILNKLDAGAYESSHFAPLTADGQGIIYVRPIAIGEGNGSSWENATSDLHNSIHAPNVQKVFVAIGTYKVGAHSFIMKNGVEMYGGFDPENGIRDLSHQRIMPNPYNIYGIYDGSILDGQSVRPVIWNIFTESIKMDDTAVLDGFLLQNGKHPTGGGVRNIYSSPTLRNIVMTSNRATVAGAGMYNENSSPVLTNVLISHNRIDTRLISEEDRGPVYGGGIYNTTNSNPVLTNVTIGENLLLTAGEAMQGAGIYNYNSSPVIRNSIFFNNAKSYSTTTAGADIQDEGSSVTSIKNSITQSYDTGNPADNLKVGVNPNFVNFGAKNFSLTVGSPAIDAGDNALFTGLNVDSKDIDGNPRVFDAENGKKIDMGAYEYQCLPVDYSIATMEDITIDYDGNPHSITAGNLVDGVSVSYEITDSDNNTTAGNTATNAGTYTITATIMPLVSGVDCEPVIKIGVLTINKMQSVITADEIQSHIYDGTQKNVIASLNHTESALSYVSQQGYTDAGVYPVTISVPETANYFGASETVNLAIENADFAGIALNDASFTYDGSPKSLEIAGALPVGAEALYSGNGKTDVGTYTVGALVQLPNYNDLWLTATMTINSALPVRWISFDGKLDDDNHAKLNWKVDQTSVADYQIERSSNAKDFRIVGNVVSAAGDGISQYSFTDAVVATGTVYYRIRQTDLDGSYSYSRIISLTGPEGVQLMAYPNPTGGKVTVQVSPEYMGTWIKLINSSGILVKQVELKGQTLEIPLDNYPAGTYILYTWDGKAVKLIKN
jgi:hypothetical protein